MATEMEYESIQREIYIDASPEIVFDVISQPEHVKCWWPDEAKYELVPGQPGEIVFGDCNSGGKVVSFMVMESDPPNTFSFRWTHPSDELPVQGNSLFVTFTLSAEGEGTTLRMIESGFREMGRDDSQVEAEYLDHVSGWDHFLARIAPYVATLEVNG